ncbi:MAG: EAL domain-containing protein [Pseudomonadota bacterium]
MPARTPFLRNLALILTAVAVILWFVVGALKLAAPNPLPRHDPGQSLRAQAAHLLAGAEAGLTRTIEQLLAVRQLAGQSCTPATINHLARLRRSHAIFWEVALVDQGGTIYCTGFGVPQAGAQITPFEMAIGDDAFLTARVDSLTRMTVPVISVVKDGRAALSASIDPLQLFAEAALGENSPVFRAEIVIAERVNSTMLHGGARDEDTLISIEARSTRFPLRVTVSGLPDPAPRPRADRWPILISGFSAGLLVALIFLMIAMRRDRPVDDLRIALKRGEFLLHYQPIFELKTQRVVGVEALIRWRHPRHGLVRPDYFIPLAEQSGLIIPLTRWVIAQSSKELAPLHAANPALYCSINLAVAHFRDFTLAETLERMVAAGAIKPSQLVLEATERQVLDDHDMAERVMRHLREHGFRIAIDDFGTGHNGLALLEHVTVDALKIDKTFVNRSRGDGADCPVLDGIIEFGHKLGLDLIAEGIEDASQLSYLRRKGVPYGQGYHLAVPMPVRQLIDFVGDPARRRPPQTRAGDKDEARPPNVIDLEGRRLQSGLSA